MQDKYLLIITKITPLKKGQPREEGSFLVHSKIGYEKFCSIDLRVMEERRLIMILSPHRTLLSLIATSNHKD